MCGHIGVDGAGVNIGRCKVVLLMLMQGSVGAGGVGAGVGGHGLLTHGCGGSSVGAGIGMLDVWMGGTPGVDGLVVTLVDMLVIMLVVVLVVMLVIILVAVLVAVFFLLVTVVVYLVAILVLLGVFSVRLVVFIGFIFVVSIPFIICFIWNTRWFGSPAALGGRSRDGLSKVVIIDWCGLLARGGIGVAKGSMWGCDTDAAHRQHALGTIIEVE